MAKDVGQIWNSVRNKDAGDAEYDLADPDFKAKLGMAAGEARQGRSTGIAGLENFEQAVAADAGVALRLSGVDAARVQSTNQPSALDAQAREAQAAATGTQAGAKPTAKAAGTQKETGKVSQKAKALKDAAGAGQKVEADEVNSPSFPSAARPLAAEAPGNTADKKTATSKRSSAKSSAKKAGK